MKNILLAAKYLAIQEGVGVINKAHVIEALKGVDIIDTKARDLIFNILDIKDLPQIQRFSEEDLKKASSHPKIEFSKDVTEFKKTLEENGISINTVISNLIVNKNTNLKRLVNIDNIKEKLKEKIYCQDVAIDAICDKLVETLYVKPEKSPKGIFFFLGPPATGKTELAIALGELLEGYKHKVFNMANYTSGNQGFALFGLSKGYADAGEGKLTGFLKRNKKAICVFDEVEKAHRAIQSAFLHVLSTGVAVDEFTQEEIDCTDAIFIFTSNLGSEIYSNHNFIEKLKNDYQSAQNIVLEAISREKILTDVGLIPALSPEFLSRISQGAVVLFNKLGYEAFENIARVSILKYCKAFKDEFGIDVEFIDMDKVIAISILSILPVIDARVVKKRLAYSIFDKITDYIRDKYTKDQKDDLTVTKIRISIDKDTEEYINPFMQFTYNEKTTKLHQMFRKNNTLSISSEISLDNGMILLVFSKPKEVKLPKSKDFSSDEGSLIFEVPDISFDDIAGHNKVKKRLKEIVSYLKNPKQLHNMGIKLPRGMLFHGLPGTGKTMLAKAFSREADLPFISVTGTEMLNIELMKKVFKRAKEYAPSIIFIDELDAIGYRDGGVRDVIINQLLTELDGFSDVDEEALFVIAATNFKEKIDPAILRSGRIDLHVNIDLLDRDARGFFIDKILRKPTEGNIDREKLITFTSGMTGADLEKVSRECALETIRQGKEKITEEIILEQINIVKYGERLSGRSVQRLVESTAYHEAGHAIISKTLMPDMKIEQITVAPRKDALGFVSYNLEDNIGNLTFEEIKNRICVSFAGRLAQIKRFGEKGLDTGAVNDLKQATRLAFYAVAVSGMDEEIGYINVYGYEEPYNAKNIDKDINERIRYLLKQQQSITKVLIDNEWAKIEKVANILIQKEYIDEQELMKIIS